MRSSTASLTPITFPMVFSQFQVLTRHSCTFQIMSIWRLSPPGKMSSR